MITLRPVVPGDDEFLCQVYGSTREAELALLDWDDAQKAAFVRMQYQAQDRYYREHYHRTSYDVILVDGEPAGRLWVDRSPEGIRVMDITLLPPFCGRGIGTHLFEGLQAEASETGTPLSIHVEQMNPARRLYERLGFQPVREHGLYTLMEWRSDVQVNTAS